MIYDITPFTTLDYPNELACIVWVAGCNMECKYCYNHKIINAKGKFDTTYLVNFLKSKQGLLDAVVFSGGECTANPKLVEYVKESKKLNFLVKIDTNGSNPSMIGKLIYSDLIDYVALDFKALENKFDYITSTNFFNHFVKTLDILIDSNINFEVRTTWHFDLLSVEEILEMNSFLRSRGYKGKYYLQKFLEVENLTSMTRSKIKPNLSLLTEDFALRGF